MNSDVSTSLLPFVDENNGPFQFGSEFVHVSPEFVDTNMSLPPATSLVPSAEPAMDTQPVNGAPVCVQICAPAMLMKKDRLAAATTTKGKVFITNGSSNVSKSSFCQKYLTPCALATENHFFRCTQIVPQTEPRNFRHELH
jgi:hypothetical protein